MPENKQPSPPSPDPEFQRELRKILTQELAVVSMLDPIHLPLHRDYMIAAVEANLEVHRETHDESRRETHPDHLEHFDEAWKNVEQQHVDFLAWLRAERKDYVWISLYPQGNPMGEWDTKADRPRLVDDNDEEDELPFD